MKIKLSKIGDRLEGRQADAGGQGFDRSALSLQSEPGIVVGGEFRGGDIKVGIGKEDPRPDDSRSISRSLVGIGHNQEGSDDKASEGETNQKLLHPHSHVQTEGGSSRERRDVDAEKVDRVDPSSRSDITPSTSRAGGSEGT